MSKHFQRFDTDRVKLGTYRSFDKESAKLGTLKQHFEIFTQSEHLPAERIFLNLILDKNPKIIPAMGILKKNKNLILNFTIFSDP